jgi:hypothetical protein
MQSTQGIGLSAEMLLLLREDAWAQNCTHRGLGQVPLVHSVPSDNLPNTPRNSSSPELICGSTNVVQSVTAGAAQLSPLRTEQAVLTSNKPKN